MIILEGKVVLPEEPPDDGDEVTELSKNCNKMKMTALLPNITLISLERRIISISAWSSLLTSSLVSDVSEGKKASFLCYKMLENSSASMKNGNCVKFELIGIIYCGFKIDHEDKHSLRFL